MQCVSYLKYNTKASAYIFAMCVMSEMFNYINMFIFFINFLFLLGFLTFISTLLRTGSGCVAWDSNSGCCVQLGHSSRHGSLSSVSLPLVGQL